MANIVGHNRETLCTRSFLRVNFVDVSTVSADCALPIFFALLHNFSRKTLSPFFALGEQKVGTC